MAENNKFIEKLVEGSGMITHHKVIDILRNQGWNVLIAPYYYDNIANTVREIDIIAEKQFNSNGLSYGSSVQINVQLFIECKYIKQEIVFWFDNKDVNNAVKKLEKDIDLRIVDNHRHSGDIVSTDFHYLTNDKVAKLFSTNTNKEDVIYKAITQCLNSKIYYDQWSNIPINLEFSEDERTETSIIKYPIIICENFDNLYNIDFYNGDYSSNQIKENFQLEINYTYLDKTKTKALTEIFLIDVLNFDNTVSFLDKLEQEIKSIMEARSSLYMTRHQ